MSGLHATKGFRAGGRNVRGPWSDAIDALFGAFDQPGSPGVNVAVTLRGEVIHQRGYGLAQVETDTAFSPDTRLHLGSTSKHFCAACVLLLEDRGLLALDDSIRRHVDGLPAMYEPISLRHLLTMTSGLPDGLNFGFFAGIAPYGLSREAHLELLRNLSEPMFPTGAGSSYSNSNYLLLTLAVERRSGMPLADFMRRELFEPLGMEATVLVEDAGVVLHGKATGYARSTAGFVVQPPLAHLNGDGGIVSTLDDLSKWLGAFESAPPLWRARMEDEAHLPDGTPTGYALGLSLSHRSGMRRIGHSGGMPGFLCDFALYPEHEIGLVMLANVSDPNLLDTSDQIAAIVARRDSAAATRAPVIDRDGIWVEHSVGFTIEFEHNAGETLVHFMGEQHRLEAIGEHRFRSRKTGSWWLLDVNEGVVIWLDGARPLRLAPFAPPPVIDLASYVGAFRNRLLGETHTVMLVEDHLQVSICSALRPLLWTILTPRGGDVFSAMIPGERSETDVSLKFSRDRRGNIDGFRYNLGRMRGVRFERI